MPTNLTWNNVPITEGVQCIVQDGAYVVHDFMQNLLGMDPESTFEQMLALPMHPIDKEIEYAPSSPFIVPGSHPSLKYRGHNLKRHKLWAQTDTETGLVKYQYTGWQYPIAKATVDVGAIPVLSQVASKMKQGLGQGFNHLIFTLYKNGDDNIGAHHDKMKDIDIASWIVVLKLGGAARKFEFYPANGSTNEDARSKDKPIWSQVLQPGAAVFMNAHGNAMVRHGVPTEEVTGQSGSIVLRCIKTVVPWSQVDKRATLTIEKRNKRQAEKKRKLDERAIDDDEKVLPFKKRARFVLRPIIVAACK